MFIFLSFIFGANFPICTDTTSQYNPATIYGNNQYYVF